MAVALALVAALAYGISDFVGGLVSRLTSAWPVAVAVQICSALGTAVLAASAGGDPSTSDLAWSTLAGAGSGVGVGFLFRGLAGGRMSVVAPLSAVGSAVVPVAVGLVTGERPGLLTLVAIAAALPGIWLVASGEEHAAPDHRGGVLDGVLAGLGFGVMFAALGQVPDGAGFWPLAWAQLVSTVAVAVLAVALGAPWRPRGRAWRAWPAGLLSALAVLCFQLSTQQGMLTVSSVVTSLYPAITVLLAMVVLRERVHRKQTLGLLLCGATVTLVALG